MRHDLEPDPDLPASEAAAWWLTRVLSDPSEQNLERLSAWQRQSPENAHAYDRMQALWALTGQAKFSPSVVSLRKRALARYIPVRWKLAAAAMIAVVPLASALYFMTAVGPGPAKPATSNAVVAEQVYRTEPGQTRPVKLADGSLVSIDGNSVVKVAYDDHERRIFLVRGQAAFDVAKHQGRPFVVHVGDRRVTATGTFFNVDKTSNKIEVTLLEGHVIVDSSAGTGRRAELSPGQQLRTGNGGDDIARTVDVKRVIAWQSGRLYLANERLDDAVEKINRHSHNQIILSDRSLGALKVSGVFRSGQIAEFAQALRVVYPVSVETTSSGDVKVSAVTH